MITSQLARKITQNIGYMQIFCLFCRILCLYPQLKWTWSNAHLWLLVCSVTIPLPSRYHLITTLQMAKHGLAFSLKGAPIVIKKTHDRAFFSMITNFGSFSYRMRRPHRSYTLSPFTMRICPFCITL